MAEAVASCVQGGFCPPACLIYLALGEEMASRRGGILLTKGEMRNYRGNCTLLMVSFQELAGTMGMLLSWATSLAATPMGPWYPPAKATTPS